MQPILEKALEKKREDKIQTQPDGEKVDLEGVTLLDYLVQQTDDTDIIRDSLMNMLVAGRDTVSHCLSSVGPGNL